MNANFQVTNPWCKTMYGMTSYYNFLVMILVSYKLKSVCVHAKCITIVSEHQ